MDADGIAEEAIRIHRGEHGPLNTDPILAELKYVCRREMVCTLEDLIDRRAGILSWTVERRLEEVRRGRVPISDLLGLTPEGFDAQYVAYEAYLRRFHTIV